MGNHINTNLHLHSLKKLSLLYVLAFVTFLPFQGQAQGDSIPVGGKPGETGPGSVQSTNAAPGAAGVSTDPAVIGAGQALFTNNCTQCHQVSDEIVVGPGLKNVHQRRPLPWLISFIRNSSKVIQSGDKYAVDLYNKFNQTLMPAHEFTDAEITSIVAYIQAESAKAPAAAAQAQTAGGQAVADGGGVSNEYITAVLIGLIIVLALILVVLVLIIIILKRYLTQRTDLDEDDREIIEPKGDMGKLLTSKPLISIVVFIFIVIAGKLTLDGVYAIGVSQGYAPKQPITFSHKLHAGQYKIDCNYCHTGVKKSKSANIPSANICMNCHNAIKTESPEIKKIYAAIENDRPIEWVRVHNLPDLAYFNHSQHVKVGGLECQTCHGPIQEMEVVQQYAPLTMGWCINCHRQTAVNAKGNEYYDKLVELHSKAGNNQPLKVQDIGGLECSKCHY